MKRKIYIDIDNTWKNRIGVDVYVDNKSKTILLDDTTSSPEQSATPHINRANLWKINKELKISILDGYEIFQKSRIKHKTKYENITIDSDISIQNWGFVSSEKEQEIDMLFNIYRG